MPAEIVDKHRLVYKNYYMKQVLKNFRQLEVIPAYDRDDLIEDQDRKGFPDREIVVNLGGDLSGESSGGKVWATCVVAEDEKTGEIVAYVEADQSLMSATKDQQKMALAHEWIHAMLAFKGDFRGLKIVSGQAEMLALFHSLKRRSYWQDSAEFSSALHKALRELLVSEDSIREMLAAEPFNTTIEDLRVKWNKDPVSEYVTIRNLIEMFAGKWSVDMDLVVDRLQQLLFG